jgi:hypothetical protein
MNFFTIGKLPASREIYHARNFFSRRGEPDAGPTVVAPVPDEVIDLGAKAQVKTKRVKRQKRLTGLAARGPLAPGVGYLGLDADSDATAAAVPAPAAPAVPKKKTDIKIPLIIVGVVAVGAFLYFRNR